MSVNITNYQPDGIHSRYVLVYEEAPALATVHEMIKHQGDERLLAICVIARDGSCEPVQVEQEDDGSWVVFQSSAEGHVIEEVSYHANGSVDHHDVLVEGFTTDEVPVFVANLRG